MEHSRFTGHTSRMLREAIILVLCGKNIAIIMATEYLARDMRKHTERIARRLGVEDMDMWDWERIGFFGLRKFAEMRDHWKKSSVVVMGDPGLQEFNERRGNRSPVPEEWPT